MSFKKKKTRKPKQNSGIKQNTKLFGNFMRNNVFFHCFYGFHVNHHIIIVMFLPFYHKLFKSKMRPKEEEKLQIFFSNFSCSSPITCLFPLCNSSVHSNQRHYQIDFQSFSMKKTFFFVSHWIGDWGRKTLGH